MAIKKYFDRLKYICELINKKRINSPSALAQKLNLSKSSTNEYIREMKELGFPLKYSKKGKHYYFEDEIEVVDKLFINKLEKNDMKNIKGGLAYYLNDNTKNTKSRNSGLEEFNFTLLLSQTDLKQENAEILLKKVS